MLEGKEKDMVYFLCILLMVTIILTQDKIISLDRYLSFVFYFLAYITISSLFAYSYTSFLYLLRASGIAGSIMSLMLLIRKDSGIDFAMKMPKNKKYLYALFPLMVFQILISFGWGFFMEEYFEISQKQDFMMALVDMNGTSMWLFGLFVVSVVIPLIEELLFRGIFVQICIQKKIPIISSVLVNGIFFGLMHMSTVSAVVPLSIFGSILAYLRLTSDSIIPSLLLHMLNNAIVILFYWGSL